MSHYSSLSLFRGTCDDTMKKELIDPNTWLNAIQEWKSFKQDDWVVCQIKYCQERFEEINANRL